MGVTMSVTVKAVQYVYGARSLSAVQIRHWFKLFAAGRTELVDLPRQARKCTGRSAENIQKVKDIVEADRRHTISAVSNISGISWSTCRRIITQDLGLVHKSAKFVPHLLLPEHLQQRLAVSTIMLQRLRTDASFLKYTVTMDESWVYIYDPELKWQSTQWLLPSDPCPVKSARPRAVGKVLLVSFFDQCGLVYREFVNRTVNSKIFVQILSRFRYAVAHHRGYKYLEKMTLHMDNASLHTSKMTRTFLLFSRTKVMLHPPYSPDLAPSDFWFYPRVKRNLRGLRHASLAALENAMDCEIADICSFEYEHCIRVSWPKRWACCVNAEGMYFEGLH